MEAGTPTLALVARQPILDARGRIRAHELLFRGDGEALLDGGSRATASVLVATFLETGLDEVSAGRPVWVNVSRDFLLGLDPLPLPADLVVLELLEDQVVDDALVARLAALRGEGFAIALDDFAWHEGAERLLELATHVKLDVLALGVDGFAEQAARLAGHDVVLLAEKVETAAEAEAAIAAGAELLQGFHFARPEAVPSRPLTGSRMASVRSAVVLAGGADIDEVERTLRTDPALSLRVLRYLNSAALATRHEVTSIRQALVLVGPRTVAQWAATLLMSDLAEARRAALAAGLVRAALCERLAGGASDEGFVVGLLSAVDVLTGAPLRDVLAGLPVADSVREAVLEGRGPLGGLLGDALRIAEGEGARTDGEAEALRAALVWADAALPPSDA